VGKSFKHNPAAGGFLRWFAILGGLNNINTVDAIFFHASGEVLRFCQR
jgi:hypothetical protein